MTRRTASRAQAPRCASENRVQPVVASQGNLFDSSSARLEKRACWRTSRHDSCLTGVVAKPDLSITEADRGYNVRVECEVRRDV